MPSVTVVFGPKTGLRSLRQNLPQSVLIVHPGDVDPQTTKRLMAAVVRTLVADKDCVVLSNNPIWVEFLWVVQACQRCPGSAALMHSLLGLSRKVWQRLLDANVSLFLSRVDRHGQIIKTTSDLDKELRQSQWFGLLSLCERFNELVSRVSLPEMCHAD